MNQANEPTRQALRGTEVEEWLNSCAPEGAFLQQAPRRTCADLGVCKNRRPACGGCEPFNALIDAPIKLPAPVAPAKPRTEWLFEIVLNKLDVILLVAVVALAYMATGT